MSKRALYTRGAAVGRPIEAGDRLRVRYARRTISNQYSEPDEIEVARTVDAADSEYGVAYVLATDNRRYAVGCIFERINEGSR